MKTANNRIHYTSHTGKGGQVDVTTVTLKSGGTVRIEEYANGVCIVEQTVGADQHEEAGGVRRTCSGSCGGVSVGPIDCPTGTSPHLDCTKNPPTLKCVKDEWA